LKLFHYTISEILNTQVTEKRLFDYDIIEIIASVVFYTHLSPKRVAETISEGHLRPIILVCTFCDLPCSFLTTSVSCFVFEPLPDNGRECAMAVDSTGDLY